VPEEKCNDVWNEGLGVLIQVFEARFCEGASPAISLIQVAALEIQTSDR
jgi:hypothetical protein